MLVTSDAKVRTSFSAITTSGRSISITRSPDLATATAIRVGDSLRTACDVAGDSVASGGATGSTISVIRGVGIVVVTNDAGSRDGHTITASITTATAPA